jgi:serpin B
LALPHGIAFIRMIGDTVGGASTKEQKMSRRVAALVVLGVILSSIDFSVKAFSMATENPAEKDQAAPKEQVAAVVEAGNRFAFDLYGQLRSGDGNLFFSPASISLALAMGYAGSAENTQAEMAKTLHFDIPKAQVNEGMQALLASWKTAEPKQGYRLDVANRLWGQDGYKFLPDFLQVTRVDYGAELARVDFRQAEEARQTINKWVEENTQDKIKNLISSADSVRGAHLVLTNAVYFKGTWTDPFGKIGTKGEDFHVAASRSVKVPLMRQTHRFRYATGDNCQLLELPYGDGHLSMVVVLPDAIDGLSQLEAKLSTANLQKWIASARSEKVSVFLPKFRTTSAFELAGTLKALGMGSAFSPSTADFSGMTGSKDLFFSAVIHKAFVDVNEEGTEAAAATGIVMRASAIAKPTKPHIFRADHPFVFLIQDNWNGAILFLGRVTDPTK